MGVLEFIRKQLLKYRDLLADLSRRNKELYYRESRGHCINLSKTPALDEHSEIIDQKFVPLRSSSSKFEDLINSGQLNLSEHFLINETGNPELCKKFDKLRLADNKFKREFGISGAWLLGPFLCWRDKANYQPEDLLISPIFKIPINLEKDKRKNWKLVLEDNTIQLNPSLHLALRQKLGITLPLKFETDSVREALTLVKNELLTANKKIIYEDFTYDSIPKIPARVKFIKNEDGEIIERQQIKIEDALSQKDLKLYQKVTFLDFSIVDVIFLDQLRANRNILIRDYDSILDSTELHPILSELFLGKPIPYEKTVGREYIRALDEYKENENYFAVNIDSSQHRALDQASKNRAIVIQGPPGTGKSQTITNIIAGNLAKGKSVLFVSEKRPALDVVYSRLHLANLDSQAVLIHSSDLNKQELYNSFLALSDTTPDKDAELSWENITTDLDKVKADVNGYYKLLESIHNPSGLLIADLFSKSALYSDIKINTILAKIFSHLTFSELNRACVILDELQTKLNKISKYIDHPWISRKLNTIYSESFLFSLTDLTNDLKDVESEIKNITKNLMNIGVDNVENIPDEEVVDKIVNLSIPEEWLPATKIVLIDPNIFKEYQQKAHLILQKIEKERSQFALINPNADHDILKQLESYFSIKRGLLDWVTPTFWKMRSYQKQYCPKWDGTNKPFRAFRVLQNEIETYKSLIENKLFPLQVDEFDPDSVVIVHKVAFNILQTIAKLGYYSRKMGLHYEEITDDYTSDNLKKLITKISDISNQRDLLINAIERKEQYLTHLSEYFENAPIVDKDKDNTSFYDALINTVRDLDLLDQIDLCIINLQENIRGSFSREIIIKHLMPLEQQWGQYVLGNVIRIWLDEARTQFPGIRLFDSSSLKNKELSFVNLEKDHRLIARQMVKNTLSNRWNSGVDETVGLTLLKKESNKQRNVLSPREIMERGALTTMMKLKPCWLMSPLSISQILPLESGLFDVIVFDEASQVRVEDAVPSIFRASSMIVVGDPKQMPPTNFFSSNTSQNDDDDEDTEGTEIEASVLDLAAQVYPLEILEWHYRSKSESLIAFSNRAFYGGRLIAAPNPHSLTEGEVIKFNRINDAYFNCESGNVVEADAVVKRLGELLLAFPNKSFGIIAMGQNQMVAIEDAIEREQEANPKFKNMIEQSSNYTSGDVDAGLFVKNLENVQGDERDIVLISIGYAPPRPGRKLFLNFGPLSKPGGGRRLNVAITRAKEKIEIFCSFSPEQIPSDEEAFGKNPDSAIFGRYLTYAAAISEKNSSVALSILNSFGVGAAIALRKSSSFSKDVQRRLEELGYQVSAEIGTSGFYIDLGIHHPVISTNFILGIECDGAIFHSTPYARDRDKIRQELLESRGWKIARVWSQDWSKDWRAEITKLDNRIKEILEGKS